MELKHSLISVILPAHNAGKFLPECIQSLLNQSYQNIEIIAIDDKSTDNTYSLLWQAHKLDKRLKVYRNKKRYGLAVCYNRALRRAKGQFIALMNPHDMSAVHRFKRQVNYLLKNPKVVAVGTQCMYINKENKKLGRSRLPQEHEDIQHTLIRAASVHFETMMVHRERLPKDLFYFTSNKFPFVYTEVFLRMLQYGKIANLTHALYFQRLETKKIYARSTKFERTIKQLQLWFKSMADYDYRPPLRSLFSPLGKQI